MRRVRSSIGVAKGGKRASHWSGVAKDGKRASPRAPTQLFHRARRLAKLGEEGEVLQDAEPGGLRAAPNAPLQACTPAATKVPAPAARRADGAPHGRARVVGGV